MVINPSRITKKKFLIVNADDFGLSPGINRGIILAFKNGIVRSTSLMVETPYTPDAVKLAKANPDLDIGLHIVLPLKARKQKENYRYFEQEIETQVLKFISFFSTKPSHMDLHGGFRLKKKIVFATKLIAAKYKLRNRDALHNVVIPHFYAEKRGKINYEAVSVNALSNILKKLKPGLTELICHPGITSHLLRDPYRTVRNKELKTLTSPEIFSLIEKERIILVNYKQANKLGFI